MTAPRFFVGIGAQKAGTTWLSDYFRTHPEVGLSPIKELHFFDAHFTDVHAGTDREWPRLRRNLATLAAETAASPVRGARLSRHYIGMLRGSVESYRRYLEALLDGHRMAGEITPAYTMLDADGFRQIESALDGPIYLLLLRNPTDRFWSQIRYRGRWADDVEHVDKLTDLLKQETYLLRSSCARVQVAMDRIAGDRLLVFFYEDLFAAGNTQAVCNELCDAMGLSHLPADPGKRVNAGDAWAEDGFDRTAVVRALKQEYLDAARRYGDALPESWQRDMALL